MWVLLKLIKIFAVFEVRRSSVSGSRSTNRSLWAYYAYGEVRVAELRGSAAAREVWLASINSQFTVFIGLTNSFGKWFMYSYQGRGPFRSDIEQVLCDWREQQEKQQVKGLGKKARVETNPYWCQCNLSVPAGSYSACSKVPTEPRVNCLILAHLFFSILNCFLAALQTLHIILIGNTCVNLDCWTLRFLERVYQQVNESQNRRGNTFTARDRGQRLHQKLGSAKTREMPEGSRVGFCCGFK